MNDLDFLKNLLQLTGMKAPAFSKTVKVLDMLTGIKQKGITQDNAVKLLSEINPKIRPLVCLLDKHEPIKTEANPYVQYNRPE